MNPYERFQQLLDAAAVQFRDIPKDERIKVISHLDADGICSAAIILRCLEHEHLQYAISIVQQVNDAVLTELAKEPFSYYIFTDLGSGHIAGINQHLKDKKVFILDHHTPGEVVPGAHIVHVNPHLAGIDGGSEISGAGTVFRFTHAVNKQIDMAHIAIIGAIGDVQEKDGFKQANMEIVEMASQSGNLLVTKGLKAFGMQTRPLYKVLEYCSDPVIPEVSGSESGAIQFLYRIGINPKKEKGWKKIADLTDAEHQKLIAGLVIARSGEKKPEEIIGNIYILPNEEEGTPFRDAKEFSTLLNSCGRLGKASLGIGACLGNLEAKKKALQVSASYKKEIVKAMKWFKEHRHSEHVTIQPGYVIINAHDHILASMAGTIASILSKSHEFPDGTLLLSMARNPLDETTKVSLRISGNHADKDMRNIIDTLTKDIPYAESGGHHAAAGAILPTIHEEQLIERAKKKFSSV